MNFTDTQIDEYLSGQLPPSERKVFEEQLKTDPAFSARVQLHKAVLAGIEMQGEKSTLEDIAAVESQLEAQGFFKALEPATIKPLSKPRLRFIRTYRYVVAAASVLLLLTVAWFVFPRLSPEERLFARLFEPYEDVLSNQIELELSEQGFADSETHLPVLKEAIFQYNAHNYDQAIEYFDDFISQSSSTVFRDKARFYKALAFVAKEEVAQAESILKDLIGSPNFELRLETQWFLLLIYLKQKNAEEALPLMNALQDLPDYRDRVALVRNTLED